VLWGSEFPKADRDWFVYLPAHGFSWWLIGEVDEEAFQDEHPVNGRG